MGIYNLGGDGGGTSELQAKEATPLITNAQQIILPDEGYDGLSKVTVNPMPAGALKTPTVNSIGYVSSGVQTAGYLDTSATSGLQLSTQAAKTITPTTYSQTAVASGKYTTGAVTVGAVSLQSKTANPSTSSQTVRADSGYIGLSQVTVNAANLQNKTVTPSSSTQYISADSGYYGLRTVTVNPVTSLSSGIQTTIPLSNVNITSHQTTIQFPYLTTNLASFYMFISTYDAGTFDIYGDFTNSNNYGILMCGAAGRAWDGTCTRSEYTVIISHTNYDAQIGFQPGSSWQLRCTFI